MPPTMTDSLKVYDILKGAHIPEGQARAITDAIREAESTTARSVQTVLDERLQHLAAREDLAEMRERLQHFATKADLADVKAELTRWMFVFWVGQMATTAGIVFAGLRVWK